MLEIYCKVNETPKARDIKEGKMSMRLCREKVAQAWCTPETSHITMIPELAEAMAVILNDIWSKPWLGNATTAELLQELKARCEINGTLDYKTVGGG